MTKNQAMKLSALAGAVITGVTGGLTMGPAGAVLGGLGALVVGLPMLFHDAPKRRPGKPDARGQIHDDEVPSR